MSVNVLIPTILIASTSYIQPVFDVNYSYAVAQINYTQPVFQSSYMQVQVTAEVTFPDVLGVEIVTPTDLVTLTFDKQVSDNTEGFEDFVSRVFSKSLADSFTIEDSIEIRRQIEKALADTQIVTEILSTSVAKALEDGSILAELASLTAAKALTDTQIVIEILSTAAVKALADTQIVTETLNTAVVKALADSFTMEDLIEISRLIEKTLEDATDGFVDQITSKATNKGLSDNFNLIDNMDGDIEYNIVKLVGELLITSDDQIIAFTQQLSDNAVASSNGTLVMQDYCDITYFLADYVGASRTFT